MCGGGEGFLSDFSARLTQGRSASDEVPGAQQRGKDQRSLATRG